jgi:hypothetical protein
VNLNDLRDEIIAADAKAAFDVLVDGFSSHASFSVQPHEQGFLNSLRIWREADFCFAAIPNDEWVLAYVRKPELRRGFLSYESVVAEFPDARLTSQGEVTLRIRDAATAERWLSVALANA